MYRLTPKHYPYNNCVLIEEFNEGRNPYTAYLEVSIDYDSDTASLKSWRGDLDISYRILRDPNDSLARWTGTPQYHVSQEAIDEAERMIINYWKNEIPALIEKGKQHPAYNQMKAIAEKEVKHFQPDFYFFDTIRLATENPDTFIWATRKTGTWMLLKTDDYHSRQEIIKHAHKETSSNLFWLYENGYLDATGYQEALEF